MSALADTWAVVVNWNGGDDNVRCLDSLAAGGIPARSTVFVDNASTDGSREAVEARYPDLTLLANSRNTGFGAGANQGAREALARGAGAVAFVNNDVTFPPGTLPRMAAVLAANPGVGAVAPRVLYPGSPARVWCAGGMLGGTANVTTLLGHGRPDGARWRAVRDVDYVPGCALLARRDVLERAGLFEESYFAYMEDVELCLRIRAAGWRVLCLGDVACHHAPSSATGGGYSVRRKYMTGLNSVRFLRAYGGAGAWLRCALFDVLALPVVLLVALPRGRGRAVLAKGLGMLHGALGRQVTARTLEPGGTVLW